MQFSYIILILSFKFNFLDFGAIFMGENIFFSILKLYQIDSRILISLEFFERNLPLAINILIGASCYKFFNIDKTSIVL